MEWFFHSWSSCYWKIKVVWGNSASKSKFNTWKINSKNAVHSTHINVVHIGVSSEVFLKYFNIIVIAISFIIIKNHLCYSKIAHAHINMKLQARAKEGHHGFRRIAIACTRSKLIPVFTFIIMGLKKILYVYYRNSVIKKILNTIICAFSLFRTNSSH